MNVDLCPSCLSELPDGYLYDHVAIDRALDGDRDLFAAMDSGERREVILAGLARGRSLYRISEDLNWPVGHLQDLLPDEHPQSRASQHATVLRQIRELYDQDLTDSAIAVRLGQHHSVIARFRRKVLGLPSKYGPGGRLKKVIAA